MVSVYFLKNKENGEIKIGSSLNPKQRAQTIKCEIKNDVDLLYIFLGGGREKEKELHEKFNDLKIHGEWFKPEDKLINFINELKSKNLINIGDLYNINHSHDLKSIMIRVDEDIHKKIKMLAKADKRSMGNYLALVIAGTIKKELKRGNQITKANNQ